MFCWAPIRRNRSIRSALDSPMRLYRRAWRLLPSVLPGHRSARPRRPAPIAPPARSTAFLSAQRSPYGYLLRQRLVLFSGCDRSLSIIRGGTIPVLLHSGFARGQFLLKVDSLISAFAVKVFDRIGQLALVKVKLRLRNLHIAAVGSCGRRFRAAPALSDAMRAWSFLMVS